MPDSNLVGRYLRVKVDSPIYIIAPPPGNAFVRFDTLKAGEVYPIAVYGLMNQGAITYARFKVVPDANAPYNGANYTYIPFRNENIYPPLQQPYVPPTGEPTLLEKIGDKLQWFLLIGAIAYVLKGWVSRGK